MSLEELHECILQNALKLNLSSISSKNIADRKFVQEFAQDSNHIIKSRLRELCIAIANPTKRVIRNLYDVPENYTISELRFYTCGSKRKRSSKLVARIECPVYISFNELKEVVPEKYIEILADIESILSSLDKAIQLQ